MVTGKDGRLVGLVTHRDILLVSPDCSLVREVMTPADRVISVGPGVAHDNRQGSAYEHRLEKAAGAG